MKKYIVFWIMAGALMCVLPIVAQESASQKDTTEMVTQDTLTADSAMTCQERTQMAHWREVDCISS